MIDDKNKIPPVNETPSTSLEGRDKETIIKQETAKEIKENIAKTPLELANEARDILYEAFSKDFNLTKEDGIRKYHIARKESSIQLKGEIIPIEGETVLGEGQMIMEVNNKGKLKIRLTTDDGMIYYLAENFSNEDLTTEIPAIKAFITDNTELPPTSKFIKENPFAGMEKEDIDKKISMNPVSSQEKVDEAPTSKYFSIPSLSEEQKKNLKLGESIDGWRMVLVKSRVENKLQRTMIIEKHIEGKEENAYIREYVFGMEEDLKGIQFFNEAAAKNLGVYTELPKDEDIPENRTKENLMKFIQDNGLKKTGKYDTNYDEFTFVNDKYFFLLQDGKFAEIDLRRASTIEVFGGINKGFGFPIVLHKK